MSSVVAGMGVAAIGAGLASTPHLRSLAELGVDLRWVATADAARARAARQLAPHARITAQTDEVLNDPEVIAVLLLTPPKTHLDLITRAARARKAVIVEKPLDMTEERARQAVELCDHAGVPLAVVHQHRFRNVVPHLKALLERGALGPLHAVEVRVPWWRAQSYYDEPGRGTYARDGGGVMITQAIHVLDLALHLCGPATVLAARTRTSALHRMQAEDLAVALLEWQCGALGTVLASTAHRPGFPDTILIVGRDGSALLEGERLRLWDREGRMTELGEVPPTAPPAHAMDFPHDCHRRLLEATLAAIGESSRVPVDGREATRVLELIGAIEAAAAARRPDEGRTGRAVGMKSFPAGCNRVAGTAGQNDGPSGANRTKRGEAR